MVERRPSKPQTRVRFPPPACRRKGRECDTGLATKGAQTRHSPRNSAGTIRRGDDIDIFVGDLVLNHIRAL
jgi:hypothetical protein